MYSGVKKSRLAYMVDVCDRCGDTLSLEKYKKEWVCSSCLKVYKRSLLSSRDLKESEREKKLFDQIVNS
jgi:hypothetical protein